MNNNTPETNAMCFKDNSSTHLNLYAMSKENLIKKVQILMHELSIFHRFEQQKSKFQDSSLETIQKQFIEKDIVIDQLKRNENILQNSLKEKIKEIQQLNNDRKQHEKTVNNIIKQNQLLKKQITAIERLKNRENSQKIDALSRQTKAKMDQLQKENKQSKKTINELMNKVKILNELNEQTEQKLANALIYKEKKQLQRQQEEGCLENKENIDMNSYGQIKLQNLSLKQQIRTLKNDLRISEESKQALRAKFHEKQLLYSKMLPFKKRQQ